MPDSLIKHFTGFCTGSQRSKKEWIERLGENNFTELKNLGALKALSGKELDGFVGRFEFNSKSQQTYRLFFDGSSIIAHPVDGGDALKDPDAQVYEAFPKKLAETIANASEFTMKEEKGPDGELIYILERMIDPREKTIVRLMIVLDDEWLNAIGAEEWVKRQAAGSQIFAFLKNGKERFPWDFNVITGVKPLPTARDNWMIDSNLYCDPRASVPSEVLAKICTDRKIVYDGINKKIFVHGEKLSLLPDKYPFKYFVGALKIGSSPMAEDSFAKEHLGLYEYSESTVRKARSGCKKAICTALETKAHLINETLAMLVPEPPRKQVLSRVRSEDVLWLPFQEI